MTVRFLFGTLNECAGDCIHRDINNKKGCAILKHLFHLWIEVCLNYLSGFSFRVLTMYDMLICGSWFCWQDVSVNSPAFEAGLRPGDLITHINDESVQSLLHTQVVQLLSSSAVLNIRCVPLDKTSIKTCSRPKGAAPGKMARRAIRKRQMKEKGAERKKGQRTLLRRLSKKGDPLVVHGTHIGPQPRTFSPLSRSASSCEGSPALQRTMRSPPIAVPWSPDSSQATSSNSSSPSSSVPNSPAAASVNAATVHMGRPSSLHVAKHKKTSSLKSPHRRKSVHNFPLSPLARTPSPSNMISSPARSPSPLAGVQGHQVGSSHLPQQTIPAHLNAAHHSSHSPPASKQPAPSSAMPKSMRPKSCEPTNSPLLRRALSPELLHPSSAEKPLLTHTLSAPSSEKPPPEKGPMLRKASLQEDKSRSDSR